MNRSNSNMLKAEVDRTVTRLALLDQAMQLGILADSSYRNKLSDDLAQMHAHGDLHAIRLELLNQHDRVLFCFRMEFGNGSAASQHPDKMETPIIERGQVKRHRIVIEHNERDPATYRDSLRTRWSDGEEAQKVKGVIVPCPDGSYFVGNGARRELVVVRSGQQYAFAETAKEPQISGIFLHPRSVPAQIWPLQAGARLNAVLVVTPDGVQARDVRAAA